MAAQRNEELTSATSSLPGRRPVLTRPVSDSAATAAAFRLRVLSHPVRIRLISMLFAAPAGEECGRVLAGSIGLPETTISHHLRQLRIAGFIESRRRGMHVYHRPHPLALNVLHSTLDQDGYFESDGYSSGIDDDGSDRTA